MGLDPGVPGSRPGPKTGAKPLSHSGIPDSTILYLVQTQNSFHFKNSFSILPRFQSRFTHCTGLFCFAGLFYSKQSLHGFGFLTVYFQDPDFFFFLIFFFNL